VTATAAIDRRVLFFGDSFVAGTGDPECRGWVGRVGAAAWAAGLAMQAYQLGVRRQTSVQVAARWRAEADPRLHEGADCRVVFSFGVNDTTIEGGAQRVETARSVATLARVLDEAQGLGLPAFVVGPPPAGDAEQDERVARLSARFAALCRDRGVPFADVIGPLRAGSSWSREAAEGDGSHPAATGYDALARLVLAAGWLDWLR
jgi:acyl-CoA thioesterase-1